MANSSKNTLWRLLGVATALTIACAACAVDTSGLDGKQFRCSDGVSCPSGTTCVDFLCEPTGMTKTDGGIDSGVLGGADLRCLNDTPGTIASEPIDIGGEITNGIGSLIGNAVVTVFDTMGGQLGAAVTDEFGDYIVSIPSNNLPVDGYISVTAAGYLETRYVAASPFSGVGSRESSTDIVLFTRSEVDAWYGTAGILRGDSSGTLRVLVHDCARDEIEGAEVDFEPAPERLVYGTSAGALTADDGVALGLNLATAPSVTVTATVGTATFRSRALPSIANSAEVVTTVTTAPP